MATEQILNSYAVVILDLLPADTRINSENPADLLPMIKNAIKKFIHDNDVAENAEEFGMKINQNLDVSSDVSVSYNKIMKSYKTTILMLASQEVKESSGFFYNLIDGIILDVSVKFAKNYTNNNLDTFRIGGGSPIRTQILDELTKIAIAIRAKNSKVPTGKTRGGGRSRYNKRSNKRSVYRRRRSSKRQSRKVSKARSTRRK